jgi:hypothetical protein
MFRVASKTFIKNIDEVKCIDCVRCIRVVSNERKYYCLKFGRDYLVSGSITYQDAGNCHDNKYQSSIFESYFEKIVR